MFLVFHQLVGRFNQDGEIGNIFCGSSAFISNHRVKRNGSCLVVQHTTNPHNSNNNNKKWRLWKQQIEAILSRQRDGPFERVFPLQLVDCVIKKCIFVLFLGLFYIFVRFLVQLVSIASLLIRALLGFFIWSCFISWSIIFRQACSLQRLLKDFLFFLFFL